MGMQSSGGAYESESAIPFAPAAKNAAPPEGADQLDKAGQTILRLLQKAAGVAEANSHHALEMAQKLSHQLRAAEDRIRSRGLSRAELGVEECNPRARALYERHGYVPYGRKPESWDEDGPDGSVRRYETVCTMMRKELR